MTDSWKQGVDPKMHENAAVLAALGMASVYEIECLGPDGELKWREEVPNIVFNEGLDDVLDKYFKGSSYTAAHYVGLIKDETSTVLAAGDTAAQIGGTNAWDEEQGYSEANRQTLTLGTVASQSVDNSASKASFSVNASITVFGAFVVTNNTKGGTGGELYGGANFSAKRTAASGDTINVTVTLTAASA